MNRTMSIVGGVVVAVVVLIVLWSFGGEQERATVEIDRMEMKQLVQSYSAGTLRDGSASITSQQLIVTHDDGRQQVYDLPDEEFFVSIAPYVEQTHPCAIHSLTGCRGELVAAQFDVLIEDGEGQIIIDEKMYAQPNGFIDLWLPRDDSYEVTVRYEGKIATSTISTNTGDQTCITTMQLMEG